MKIKTDIEFISFSDGVCNIYKLDEDENRTEKYIGLGFSNRVLGYNRVFVAAANQVQVNRVIKIPNLLNIDTHDTVEIKGMGKYGIELVQIIYDTNPPSIDLTLRELEMFKVTL